MESLPLEPVYTQQLVSVLIITALIYYFLCVLVSYPCITNDHKLGGLKQQKFIRSQLWRPAV